MRRLAFALSCLFVSSFANAAPIDDAKALLKQGKVEEGMALLESRLSDFAQDPEYNYLLGIASLDAGKPVRAVMAFERTLAISPGHVYARAELARALIAIPDLEGARREINQVQQQPLPPEMAARVKELSAQLEGALARQAAEKERAGSIWRAYLEGELGYDTNINTGSNDTRIGLTVPPITVTLTGLATSQRSGLLGVNGGIFGLSKLSSDVDIYGNLDGRFRYHWDETDFKPASVYAGAGLRLTRGKNQFSVGLTKYEYYVGDQHNDDQTGIYGQWQHIFSRQDQAGLFIQKLRIDHPIANYLDTDMLLAGATWTHAYQKEGSPTMNLTVYLGDEDERSNDPTVGRKLSGFKLGADYMLREDLKLFGSLGVQHSNYGGRSPFFLKSREDWRYDLNVGATYKLSRVWSLTPQFSYTRSDSSIPFNDFSREQIIVTLRRDFF